VVGLKRWKKEGKQRDRGRQKKQIPVLLEHRKKKKIRVPQGPRKFLVYRAFQHRVIAKETLKRPEVLLETREIRGVTGLGPRFTMRKGETSAVAKKS